MEILAQCAFHLGQVQRNRVEAIAFQCALARLQLLLHECSKDDGFRCWRGRGLGRPTRRHELPDADAGRQRQQALFQAEEEQLDTACKSLSLGAVEPGRDSVSLAKLVELAEPRAAFLL